MSAPSVVDPEHDSRQSRLSDFIKTGTLVATLLDVMRSVRGLDVYLEWVR